jgi:hypothetical protein
VLQHATAEQLFMLEHHNPYLIEDTGELWQFHCQREFRTKQRQDMETAREMYMASYPALILQLGLGAEKYCYGVYFVALPCSPVSGLLALRSLSSLNCLICCLRNFCVQKLQVCLYSVLFMPNEADTCLIL